MPGQTAGQCRAQTATVSCPSLYQSQHPFYVCELSIINPFFCIYEQLIGVFRSTHEIRHYSMFVLDLTSDKHRVSHSEEAGFTSWYYKSYRIEYPDDLDCLFCCCIIHISYRHHAQTCCVTPSCRPPTHRGLRVEIISRPSVEIPWCCLWLWTVSGTRCTNTPGRLYRCHEDASSESAVRSVSVGRGNAALKVSLGLNCQFKSI